MTIIKMTFEEQCKILKELKDNQKEAFLAFLKDKLSYYKWSEQRAKLLERKHRLTIKALTVEQLIDSFEKQFK